MVFLHSYTILRLARCKTSEVTNFIFRNISTSSKLALCSSIDNLKDKAPNKIPNDCRFAENITSNGKSYVGGLTNDISEKNNEDNKCDAHNVNLLDTHKHKLTDTLEDIDEKLSGPLDPCNEDLSHIGPHITATYNLAKFADNSYTLQQLVKLGVELYKLESDRDVTEMLLTLDFEKDIKPYIQFLHDCGVMPERLGYFITRNPKIFKENMDDLHTRIRYLRAHMFSPDMIKSIVNKHPPWLSFKTKIIDYRLGHFQNAYKLSGEQVRHLTVTCPKLITYDMNRIRSSSFAVQEEMGFNLIQAQLILLQAPRVWIRAKVEVVKTFDYAHNKMKLSHKTIALQPIILLCRQHRLQRRHEFLVHLQKDQYDPLKPLYVSPKVLVTGTDVDFCNNVAKCSIDTYNLFLKSF